MAVISLPLSFNNSFWTQDYRTGLEVLFHKLEQNVIENDEIIAFVRARANTEGDLATSLKNPTSVGNSATGFDIDDGASLRMAFRGMQAESQAQGRAHEAVAQDLHTLVADPFEQWAQGHKEKLRQAKITALDGWLRSYEYAQEDVKKVKGQYQTKTRRADEAEDDARFAPNEIGDKFTSPRLGPQDLRNTPKGPQRQQTVSERITQRLRDIGKAAVANAADPPVKAEQVFDAGPEKSPSLKADKGKGKATSLTSSPSPLTPPLPPTLSIIPPPAPPPLLLAGLPFTPSDIAQFLTKAKAELALRRVRFPILGEYPDCFSGEEFVTWLRENIEVFEREPETAESAAKDLTEREDLLRRIGEFGNAFENADDAFYQFRPKAFTFGQPPTQVNKSPLATSPIQRIAPVADNLVKTSSSFVNIVSKALNSGPTDPSFLRLRREADAANNEYHIAVRNLDRQRLGLEERIEDTLKGLQKWETERLHAVKTALLQYQGSISSLRKVYDTSVDRSATLISSYNPDSDLSALIERYRTGPFRPAPQMYESLTHDEQDVVFGIDLRKWAEGSWSTTSGEERRDQIPPVLLTLLTKLNEKYGTYSDDAEKRKTWIYEVPLTAVHHLRESLNAVPVGQDIPEDLLNKYDAPVIAGAVKVWMLELDPPLGMYESWDEVRKIYPTIGAKSTGEVPQQQHLEAVRNALEKLPKVHLFVLDAIVHHFKELIDNTRTDESDEVYLTKLALSVGRGILRPKYENEISIQDRHPTLFLIELVEHYDKLLPPTIMKKKRESDRKIPTRKRTAIVDMRMRRSQLSDSADLKDVIIAQHRAKSPPSGKSAASRSSFSSTTAPSVAPVPENIKVQAPVAVNPKSHELPAALRASATPATVSPSAPAFVPPPPPPLVAIPPPPPIIAPPPPPPILNQVPPRPTFKEPPPEMDDLPPRPSFKEPPPELDDEQQFETPEVSPKISSLPFRTGSPAARNTGLSRATSTEASRVRGPRITRGPRTVARVRRDSASFRPQTPPSPAPSPRGHVRTWSRGSVSNTSPPHRRSGSASSFSRRTMASDAEDQVVDQ